MTDFLTVFPRCRYLSPQSLPETTHFFRFRCIFFVFRCILFVFRWLYSIGTETNGKLAFMASLRSNSLSAFRYRRVRSFRTLNPELEITPAVWHKSVLLEQCNSSRSAPPAKSRKAPTLSLLDIACLTEQPNVNNPRREEIQSITSVHS